MMTADDLTLPSRPDFADLGLPDHLLEAVTGLGFKSPTDIQAAAIPELLAGHDIVCVAQTGTGKTAAFGLPLLAAVDPALPEPQALVLAPTRELAIQVAAAIKDFAQTSPGLRVATIYGGASYGPQKHDLAAGAQVVVGTPGRVIDHLDQGTLTLDSLRFLVLDEGDEMLRMGFAEEVDAILSQAPADRLTALFSATWPPAIRATAARHLRAPRHISVTRPATVAVNVDQRYTVVPHRHKVGVLARILAASQAEAAIVFVRTRAEAEEVSQALAARGLDAAGISGEVAQRERERIVDRLRRGRLGVLVATDVAARGLDVDRIGLVVNFDLPRQAEDYVHRIGRTGRAGRAGLALTFVTPAERGRLRAIERALHCKIVEQPAPTVQDVAEQRYAALLGRALDRVAAGQLGAARRAVTQAVEDGTDPLSLAAALAARALHDDGNQDGAAAEEADLDAALAELRDRNRGSDRAQPDGSGRDWAATGQPRRRKGDRWNRADRPTGCQRRGSNPSRAGRGGPRRYWIGVGRGHGASPGAIVGAITGQGELNGGDLGRIDMFQHFSLIEIGSDLSRDTMRRLAGAKVAGRKLRIRPNGFDQ
ncbi:MAG: DEAD/DEAH box helicase [Propionibacteriaceae bacterium]|jgi:ATP-dependent RNA helicase DeaD|nr:DEAD/DEAH box helicase [Propionibacteriaceae bacterium]